MNKFEPQCKTQADLHREWARVLDMCAGTSVNPVDCVKNPAAKYNEISINDIFNILPTWTEFAIAIVEGRPVFRGDVLYNENGVACVVVDDSTVVINSVRKFDLHSLNILSWNPPKTKFNVDDCVYCKVDNPLFKHEGKAKIIALNHMDGFYRVQFDDCGTVVCADESMLSKQPPKKTISLIDVPAPSQSGYMRTCDDKELIWNMRFDSSEDALNFAKEIRRTTFK
jgi:hypothetical protein